MTTADSSSQALLKAAKKLFAEKGYNATTVKEIADEAGLNVSLVSYHFKGKENLFIECLEQFGQNRLASSQRILKPAENKEEFKVRLSMFIEEFFQDALADTEIHQIMQRECFAGNDLAKPIYEGTLNKAFECVVSFFHHAQKNKIIRNELEPKICADMLLGALIHVIRREFKGLPLLSQSIKNEKIRQLLNQNYLTTFLEGWYGQDKKSQK